jgi:hypothetical protein
VTATNAAGCTATASGTVTVNALPTASIAVSPSSTITYGQTATLTASGGSSYAWSTSATTAAISTTCGGTYTVTVTNSNGCTATASQVITGQTVSALTLTSMCSDTPSVTLRWRVNNPNSFSVPFTYTVLGTPAQSGSGTAAPGQSYFFINNVSGIRYYYDLLE